MEIAKEAAPQVDRLVWSVNSALGPTYGAELDKIAARQGLDSPDMLVALADFLLEGSLTSTLVVLRMRYTPPITVLQRLEELVARDFVELSRNGLVATPSLRPVLEAVVDGRAAIARSLWEDHGTDVGVVSETARRVSLVASGDHVVAVAHGLLTEPTDGYLRLYQRLQTLRYIRQHDHAAAWQSREISADEIVLLTALWNGSASDGTSRAASKLVDRGLAVGNPLGLTPAGRQLRDEIETDTNLRNQRSFDVLSDDEAMRFSQALRRLPGTPG